MRPLFTTPYVRCLSPVCTLAVYHPPICPLFITPARVSTVCRLMGDDVRQVTVGCVMRMRPLFTTPYVRCLTPMCTLSVYPPPPRPLFITPTRVSSCLIRMRPLLTTPYARCLSPVRALAVYPPYVRCVSPPTACPLSTVHSHPTEHITSLRAHY